LDPARSILRRVGVPHLQQTELSLASQRGLSGVLLVTAALGAIVAAVLYVNAHQVDHHVRKPRVIVPNASHRPLTVVRGSQPSARSVAAAQTAQPDHVPLFKCIDKAGISIYQDHPCADDEDRVWVRSVRPEKAVAPATRSLVVSSAPASNGGYTYRRESEADRRKAHCADVKRQVADQEAALGLRRTIDDLRRWDARVQAACKGV
jgi:hypothetical protein